MCHRTVYMERRVVICADACWIAGLKFPTLSLFSAAADKFQTNCKILSTSTEK